LATSPQSPNLWAMADDGKQVDTKKAILESLEAHYGIVTDSCRAIGLSRATYYDWLKNDPEFKAAVDEIQEVAIDYVEGKLFERISGVEVLKGVDKDGNEIVYTLPPDTQAILGYLKTKGKKRGYVERNENRQVDEDGKTVNELTIKIIRDTSTGIAPGEFTPESKTGTSAE
jgi:hypothetical protein